MVELSGARAKAALLGKKSTDKTTIRKIKLNQALKEESLFMPIREQVDTYAKLTHLATIFSNMVVEYAIKNDRLDELPQKKSEFQGFLQKCVIAVRDYPSESKIPQLLKDTLEEYWSDPELNYEKPMGYLLAPVAKELATNVVNHLFVHYYDRQLRALKKEPISRDLLESTKDACYNESPTTTQIRNKLAELRQKEINGSEYDGDDTVVIAHREKLNANGEQVNHLWIQKNCAKAMNYLYFLGLIESGVAKENIAYHDANGETQSNFIKSRCFTILPIRGYSPHSLPIESGGLYGFMKKVGLLPVGYDPKEMTSDQVEHFSRCFDFDRFAKDGKVIPACRVTTDGVQCSLSFFIPNSKKPSKGSKKGELPYKKWIDLTTVENGLFTEKNCRLIGIDLNKIVGVDPGRHTLLTMTNGSSFLSYGKKQHYNDCYFTRGRHARERWFKKADVTLKESVRASSTQSFNIGEDLKSSWDCRATFEEDLWSYYGDSKWRNLKFKQYLRKQQAYSNLVNRIKERFGDDAILAFGAAKFNVTSVGDVSGPLVEMARELSRYFRVVYTNEFRSSACCYSCGLKMGSVKRLSTDKEKSYGTVFCIKHCEQCSRYRNRDKNASLNIREFANRRLSNNQVRLNFLRSTKVLITEPNYTLGVLVIGSHVNIPVLNEGNRKTRSPHRLGR